jgi:putative aminopeptidase FrvX
MKDLPLDRDYLLATLEALLAIPSPSGMTDNIVAYVCTRLNELGIKYELTRRGAIRADLKGRLNSLIARSPHISTRSARW